MQRFEGAAMKRLLTLLTAAMASLSAHADGTVEVSFVKPEQFADVRSTYQRVDDGFLKALATHFQSAAAPHVPDGQTLRIEVLDVDLAGEIRPRFAASYDVRVVGLGADWPRLKFRYSMSSASGAAELAEVQLSDMAYNFRSTGRYSKETLSYERRMIDEWVGKTFAAK
jgi:Protein of unknown function (DUF3016)